MLLQATQELPEGTEWSYEPKLDGFRAIGVKTGGKVALLRSPVDRDLIGKFPTLIRALRSVPNETVVDGEIVAMDNLGRSSRARLQNERSCKTEIFYYIFDVLILAGHNVMAEPLSVRRRLLHERLFPKLREPIRACPELSAPLADLVASVRRCEFGGLVAKRLDSKYEPGAWTGAWRKMWVKQAHDFVIGGYTVSAGNFDALIFGYYDEDRLLYAARARIGFTPELEGRLQEQFRNIETPACPFANLPEKANPRRRGVGVALTVGKMKECHWLQPMLVGQFEFLDWTEENRIRYSQFVGLQGGKDPRECTVNNVGRETLGERGSEPATWRSRRL